MVTLYEHQKNAIELLRSGSILCGGVGSGKSRTAIAYFYLKECKGKIKINGEGGYSPMRHPIDLYIITTAKKRDSFEWEKECSLFMLGKDRTSSCNGVKVTVDSWNNISKYILIKNAFFIFDEQRISGSGAWVKSFLKISKENHWILLSATPGDTWSDYIPVFIANGFYKSRSEFLRKHAIYNPFLPYSKIERYVDCGTLLKYKNQILVTMEYKKPTISHWEKCSCEYDKTLFNSILKSRWNIWDNVPIKNISELCFLLRKIVNSDRSRIQCISDLLEKHNKIIIFYNFDYELEILRSLSKRVTVAEYNGHRHDEIPKEERWVYLVQYSSGAEGWNCIETNAMIFYSLNYSYKIMMQASGRIDRMNTSYSDLFYYVLRSNASIDLAIIKALKNKKIFNETKFMNI